MRAPPQRQIQRKSVERDYAEEPIAAGQAGHMGAILRLRLTVALS